MTILSLALALSVGVALPTAPGGGPWEPCVETCIIGGPCLFECEVGLACLEIDGLSQCSPLCATDADCQPPDVLAEAQCSEQGMCIVQCESSDQCTDEQTCVPFEDEGACLGGGS